MKKILLTLLTLLILPVTSYATIAVSWNATSTDSGFIQPTAVNGNIDAIKVPYITATSTTSTSTFQGVVSNATTTVIASAVPQWFPPTIQPGGSLTSTTTYYYKIVARTIDGTTLASLETSTTTTSANKTIELNWALFPGATSYDIYRTTTSGVYGATSFLVNINAFLAYQNWLSGTLDAPYGRNIYNDDGTIALTSGTPPMVNSAYLNKIGTLNHFGGSIFYQAPLTVNGVSTMTDSPTDLQVPLTSPIQINPTTELSDSQDIPIFTVGLDTVGSVGSDTLGMWWETGDIGAKQFHLRNAANTFDADFKAGQINGTGLNVGDGQVNAGTYSAFTAGSYSNPTYAIQAGVLSGFYPNDTSFPFSWAWASNQNVNLYMGYGRFSLPGGTIIRDTATYGADRMNRFNVFSLDDALQSGTIVNDGVGNTTGTGTLFTKEFGLGDTISVGGTEGIITAITDDTHIITAPPLSAFVSGPPTKKQAVIGLGTPSVPQAFYIGYDGRFGFGGLPDSTNQYSFKDPSNHGTTFEGKTSVSGVFTANGASQFNQNVTIANTKLLTLGQGSNIVLNTTTGTKIGTAANQLLGFFNATPIVQPVNTDAINDVLVNLGLRAASGLSNFSTTLLLKAGGTAASTEPMRWTASTALLSTPVALSEEHDNDKRYYTITTGTARKEYTLNDSALTSGTIPVATTNGRLTDSTPANIATALSATSTGSFRNQSATVSSVNTYTPTASSTYSISVSADVDAVTADTLTITCTYTNTNNVASTATFFPMGLTSAGLTTTGSPAFTALIITPMKNTAVTVVSTVTGVGSISYDIDASILPIGTLTK